MTERSDQEHGINDLVGAVFQVNSRLVEVGNRLMVDIGLTDAWWQVLVAIAFSPVPLSVAQIARHMGLSRQAVQRIVDLLAHRGLVQFAPNPDHRRAKLVVLTAEGWAAEKAAYERWRPWASDLEVALGQAQVVAAFDVLSRMNAFLTNALSLVGQETDL